ncbi:MAG: hypothetical protein ABSB33_04275 [Tepidisphaeraceae bacterium]|jgi:hypothetical protein
MMRQQFHSTLIWAVGSFGVALALGLPLTSDAVNQPPATPLVQLIRSPGLTENGIELTVETAGATTRRSVETCDQPLMFLVRAHNGSNAAGTADFTLQLTSAAVPGLFARTLPVPKEIWADSGSFDLNPGETKTLHFTTGALPPGRKIELNLRAGQSQITALSLASEAVVSPTTRPAMAFQ